MGADAIIDPAATGGLLVKDPSKWTAFDFFTFRWMSSDAQARAHAQTYAYARMRMRMRTRTYTHARTMVRARCTET